MTSRLIAAGAVALACSVVTMAQGGRPAVWPAPPRPKCSKHDTSGGEPVYKGGNGSRLPTAVRSNGPRCLGGSGASYGKLANPDAPVWRAANNSTQLKTEVPLVIAGKTVAPGTTRCSSI
jgi:hypothetical protein